MKSKNQTKHSAQQRVKIRYTKNKTHNNPSPLHHEFGQMTREESLKTIAHYLDINPIHPLAHALIDLFQVHGEELTEAGVAYETVKAMEKEYPLLKCLNA